MDNLELINFINKEKTYNYLNNPKIYSCFIKCFIKTLINIHTKLNEIININNINTHVITGSNVMYHVFWIIINYTNNLSVTIFLSEKAVLLYTEFILMAQNPIINKELYYIPNLIDAMNFAYKKTIGPININNNKLSYKNNNIIFFKILIQYIYNHINKDNLENIENYFNYVNIIKITKLINNDEIYNILFEKLNILIFSNDSLLDTLLKIKILVELLYINRYNNITDILKKLTLYTSFMDTYKINETIKLNNSVKKYDLFQKLKNI